MPGLSPAAGRRDRPRRLLRATRDPRDVLLACMKLGATYAALNFRLSPAVIRTVPAAGGARVIFLSARYQEIVDDCRGVRDQAVWRSTAGGTGPA